MATPRSKHIASNVANRYVAWFKYADLLITHAPGFELLTAEHMQKILLAITSYLLVRMDRTE
jgi:hypothetical protein